MVTGQNGSGQNGTDKMVWTKWYMNKMVLDKMVWTKWHMDKMVYNLTFCVHFNSVEFSIIFRNQKSQINYKHTEES